MPFERIKVESALTKKGFKLGNNNSLSQKKRDHRWYWLYIDGKSTIIRTKVSIGSGYKTLDDTLLSQMSRQLCFEKFGDFKNFIICKMSEKAYKKNLLDRGVKLRTK